MQFALFGSVYTKLIPNSIKWSLVTDRWDSQAAASWARDAAELSKYLALPSEHTRCAWISVMVWILVAENSCELQKRNRRGSSTESGLKSTWINMLKTWSLFLQSRVGRCGHVVNCSQAESGFLSTLPFYFSTVRALEEARPSSCFICSGHTWKFTCSIVTVLMGSLCSVFPAWDLVEQPSFIYICTIHPPKHLSTHWCANPLI